MIKNISIDLLVPFENHPFKKRSGIEQQELTESIKENGLLEPIIVRPFPAGKYEIISGHRRVEVCKELSITEVPAIIEELTKDEAIVQMVDSNIHREHILPSEKAFAYKMKSEALKHQGKTSCQLGTKSRTDEKIAETADDSARQIQRYIRLTYLIPELLELVDEERIAFTPAVEISYLSEYEQQILLEQIEFTDATPSLSQAQRLRKFSKDSNFFVDTVFAILNEEKPNQKGQVRIPADKLRDVLPKGLDKQKTEDFIIKACEHYRKYLIRRRDNVNGKVSNEWFVELSHKYEKERMDLKAKIADTRHKIEELKNNNSEYEKFISAIRRFMQMDNLTSPLLRELIDHIDIFETEGTGKSRTQRIVIYYRFIGYIELPNTTKQTHIADTRKGVAVEYITEQFTA